MLIDFQYVTAESRWQHLDDCCIFCLSILTHLTLHFFFYQARKRMKMTRNKQWTKRGMLLSKTYYIHFDIRNGKVAELHILRNCWMVLIILFFQKWHRKCWASSNKKRCKVQRRGRWWGRKRWRWCRKWRRKQHWRDS